MHRYFVKINKISQETPQKLCKYGKGKYEKKHNIMMMMMMRSKRQQQPAAVTDS